MKTNHITYQPSVTEVIVLLGGNKVGRIKAVTGGFAYFPTGQTTPGETFSTIADVKQSLEAE